MKKFTLLRMYHEKCGMDLSNIYDIDNILNAKKKQLQEDWLDNTAIEEIADIIDQKIMDVRLTYVENANESAEVAGEGALELLERLRDTPEMGYPLFSPLLTTITRGARLKKFYLRYNEEDIKNSSFSVKRTFGFFDCCYFSSKCCPIKP